MNQPGTREAPCPAVPRTGRRAARRALTLLWRQPLYAVPFAVFFWVLFSGWTFAGFRRAYLLSLVFAYAIGYSIFALQTWVLPRLGMPRYRGGDRPLAVEMGAYFAAAMFGSAAAAVFNHFFVLPGFLGTPRSALITAAFALLFGGLFTGVSYAMVFYRQSLERARKIEAARAELAQAELRALRAQIHPHFLFNTLNSIAALIPADPAGAEDMTTRLAEVFRYTLRASDHDTATLEDEMGFLADYLAIERARFGERLRVEMDVAADARGARIPSLLLQPIVENAVHHAVAARAEGGTIRVRARRAARGLEISVSDDGPGFAGTAPAGNGFGLHSVRERLRASGLGGALEIESAPGRGATVRILLPSAGTDRR